MPRFLVYEVWTRHVVVEADSLKEAYDVAEPVPRDDLSLSNWHVVSLDEPGIAPYEPSGGLNYRQKEE